MVRMPKSQRTGVQLDRRRDLLEEDVVAEAVHTAVGNRDPVDILAAPRMAAAVHTLTP